MASGWYSLVSVASGGQVQFVRSTPSGPITANWTCPREAWSFCCPNGNRKESRYVFISQVVRVGG